MNKRGIINTIVLIVIAILLLNYFKVDVPQILATAFSYENFAFAWQLITDKVASLILSLRATLGI